MYIAYLLLRYCAKANITIIELAKYFGEPVPTVRAWISGQQYPEDKHLLIMAYLFVGKVDVEACVSAYAKFQNLRDLDKQSKDGYNNLEF